MKVAFFWDWHVPLSDVVQNMDFFPKAAEALAKKGHEVDFFTFTHEASELHFSRGANYHVYDDAWRLLRDKKPWDVGFFWGSIDRPLHSIARSLAKKTYLHVAGGLLLNPQSAAHPFMAQFDGYVVESEAEARILLGAPNVHVQPFDVYVNGATGQTVSSALGVETKFWSRSIRRALWTCLVPGSFTPNKRFELFQEAWTLVQKNFSGLDRLALLVGRYENQGVLDSASRGSWVFTLDRLPPHALKSAYDSSLVACVPGGLDGGGNRVVLEALANGLPCVVCEDNVRCAELVREAGHPEWVAKPDAGSLAEALVKAITWGGDHHQLQAQVGKNRDNANYANLLETLLTFDSAGLPATIPGGVAPVPP